MKEVKKQQIFKVKLSKELPFCAVGIIQAVFSDKATLQATGTLITKNHVITPASNVYNLHLKMEATQIYFYAENINQQDSLKQKIKIKKVNYSPKYKQSSSQDRRNYQLAVLQLENNNFIKKQQCLGIHWNWKRSLIIQNLLLIGYPSDKQQTINKYETYNQFMFKGQLIAIYDNWIKYGHQLSQGTTGAPIIIQEQGKFELIGMHLGVMMNVRFGILFSNSLQSSYNVLKEICKQQVQIQKLLMIQQSYEYKLEQKVFQLENEVQKLKKQKQLMKCQLQKLNLNCDK